MQSREVNHYVKAIKEDQLITAAAESVPDALPLPDEQKNAMVGRVPLSGVKPEARLP